MESYADSLLIKGNETLLGEFAVVREQLEADLLALMGEEDVSYMISAKQKAYKLSLVRKLILYRKKAEGFSASDIKMLGKPFVVVDKSGPVLLPISEEEKEIIIALKKLGFYEFGLSFKVDGKRFDVSVKDIVINECLCGDNSSQGSEAIN